MRKSVVRLLCQHTLFLLTKFVYCACLRWSEATTTCIKTSTRLNAKNEFI